MECLWKLLWPACPLQPKQQCPCQSCPLRNFFVRAPVPLYGGRALILWRTIQHAEADSAGSARRLGAASTHLQHLSTHSPKSRSRMSKRQRCGSASDVLKRVSDVHRWLSNETLTHPTPSHWTVNSAISLRDGWMGHVLSSGAHKCVYQTHLEDAHQLIPVVIKRYGSVHVLFRDVSEVKEAQCSTRSCHGCT